MIEIKKKSGMRDLKLTSNKTLRFTEKYILLINKMNSIQNNKEPEGSKTKQKVVLLIWKNVIQMYI